MNVTHRRTTKVTAIKNSLRARVARWLVGIVGGMALCSSALAQQAADNAAKAPHPLRIVGGIGALNQYTLHEQPFWTKDLARLSGGKLTADIVAFDQAGIRGQEMLRLVQLGAVPFGTSLLNLSAVEDAEFGAVDLAALNPDMNSLRRTVAVFRDHLAKTLRQRYGIELLAVYAYPAQTTFCARPVASLADLKGLRVRVSSATQGDWVAALGGSPVQMKLSDVVPGLRDKSLDCAITGTMSGFTIGLHEVTSHILSTPVNWGVAMFVANGAAWNALPPDMRDLLKRELPVLEKTIWEAADKETAAGVACNTGASSCAAVTKGRMIEVKASAADVKRMRDILVSSVLPGWVNRCGPDCTQLWNASIGNAANLKMP
jgi:TRAP-type C4-dicarboxylate transport system substrate-binding protein